MASLHLHRLFSIIYFIHIKYRSTRFENLPLEIDNIQYWTLYTLRDMLLIIYFYLLVFDAREEKKKKNSIRFIDDINGNKFSIGD